MSNWTATHSYKGKDYQETCDYCGCVFHMVSELQDGHNETEEYYCPECNKEFRIGASNSPRVTLVSKRTDGRTNHFNND